MFNINFCFKKNLIKLKDNTYQNLKNEIEKYINGIRSYNVVNGDNEIINENTDLDKLKNHELLVTLKGKKSENLNHKNTFLLNCNDNFDNLNEEYINKKSKIELKNKNIEKKKFQEEENTNNFNVDDLRNEINKYIEIKNNLRVTIEKMEQRLKDLTEKMENAKKDLKNIETQIAYKIKEFHQINYIYELENYLTRKQKLLQNNKEQLEKKNNNNIKIEGKKQNNNFLKIKQYEEELKKDLYFEIIHIKNSEDIKNKYLNEISKNIKSYLKEIEPEILNIIKKKIDEKIESYIGKLNQFEKNRNLRFKEEEEKYKNIKLAMFKEYEENNVIHFNKKCNKCQDNPIKGILYQCSHCNEYYLCEQCEQINYLEKIHPYNFIKIRKYSHK